MPWRTPHSGGLLSNLDHLGLCSVHLNLDKQVILHFTPFNTLPTKLPQWVMPQWYNFEDGGLPSILEVTTCWSYSTVATTKCKRHTIRCYLMAAKVKIMQVSALKLCKVFYADGYHWINFAKIKILLQVAFQNAFYLPVWQAKPMNHYQPKHVTPCKL